MKDSNYRRYLPHFNQDNAVYFVTFSTRQKLYLPPEARTIILDSFQYNANKRYEYYQGIVMPDHAHMLLKPLENFELKSILQGIKGYTGHVINKLVGRHGQVWEQESFDTIQRDDLHLQETITYLRFNAVNASLVEQVEKYPWYFEDLGKLGCYF